MDVLTAITQICERLGDPDFGRYADSNDDYDGLAKDVLVNNIIALMATPETKEEDIHGYVKEAAVTIASGEVTLSAIGSDNVLRVIDYYPNLDGSNPLLKVIEKVDFQQFRELSESGLLVANTESVYIYRVGNKIKFYPASQADTFEINIVYVAQPVVSGGVGDITLSSTDLLTYFSIEIIIKAINLTVQQLLQDRNQ